MEYENNIFYITRDGRKAEFICYEKPIFLETVAKFHTDEFNSFYVYANTGMVNLSSLEKLNGRDIKHVYHHLDIIGPVEITPKVNEMKANLIVNREVIQTGTYGCIDIDSYVDDGEGGEPDINFDFNGNLSSKDFIEAGEMFLALGEFWKRFE